MLINSRLSPQKYRLSGQEDTMAERFYCDWQKEGEILQLDKAEFSTHLKSHEINKWGSHFSL